MSPHPALRRSAIERLRDEVVPDTADAPEPAVPTASGPPPEPGGVRGRVKSVIRKGIAWYVDPAAVDAADAAAERIADRLLDALLPRLDRLEERLNERDDAEVRAQTINLQLLKGEVRALQQTLGELGLAIAPAAGLDAAADRMSELRERLNALERRTRPRPAAAPPPVAATATTPVAAAATTPPSRPTLDYRGFEQRFRGDAAVVTARIRERYADLVRDHPPVLDIGCGRGELLSVLREEGIGSMGVDLDADMAAEARERGLDVVEGDALAYLRERREDSIGAVISLHLIEHLELESLLELLELSRSRLHPGGLFVAETPNPASLIVLGNSYILDPTHVRPLHPSLMVFLCESAGFRDVRLEFYEPARDYHLPQIEHPDAPPWVAQVNAAFERLNQVLFGAQEYAVIATVPPA